ncbi:hypothetical protein L208DRAFT_1392913 [Tricholoma matsutake]|nr:hypothetical protein L208DRAFT_1392913 [Tricholoma matsutake 945]
MSKRFRRISGCGRSIQGHRNTRSEGEVQESGICIVGYEELGFKAKREIILT